MATLQLTVIKQSNNDQALTNLAYVDTASFNYLRSNASQSVSLAPEINAVRGVVKDYVLTIVEDRAMPPNSIAVSKAFRDTLRLALDVQTTVRVFESNRTTAEYRAGTIALQLTPSLKDNTYEVTDATLEEVLRKKLNGFMLTRGQRLFIEAPVDMKPAIRNFHMVATVKRIEGLRFGVSRVGDEADDTAVTMLYGLVNAETEFELESELRNLEIKRRKTRTKNLFRSDFNFEQLGIGGLDKEFADIFRRAFASRIYPPDVIKELGITHVRGMLLYGPPGTGKTLIARQIGKALRAKEPKIVNGPEVLNKYVGQSEENIRKLFADAEADQKKMGDNSPLHIIIFDELDAICRQRGSVPSGAGVGDSIVNQLLSKIDGVDALNNILLIGMTNRLDMLDEALLRPGRLEVHIEIGLPDEAGRLQILKIHTSSISKSNRLAQDVDLRELAARTKNFSGAEIAGLIRSAVSFAFARDVDPTTMAPTSTEIAITMADFEQALKEVIPAFGVAEDALSKYMIYGIIPFSSAVEKLRTDLMSLANQVKTSSNSPLISVLLWGTAGSGKTSLAAELGQRSGFPFVKIISPANFIGYHETAKVIQITKIFDDAYKSDLSMIILDDLERLLDYTAIGPRFSNVLLQALTVLVKKPPPKENRRILIVGTTSEPSFMQDCGLLQAFQLAYNQPQIKSGEALITCVRAQSTALKISDQEILELAKALYAADPSSAVSSMKLPVKKLFLALEMAKQLANSAGATAITAKLVVQCLRDFGISR